MKLTPVEKNACDALTYLVQSARLPVTAMSIQEGLYLHPDFPSLLAMSDVLTGWNVANMATRIHPDQLLEIPLPAIAYLESNGGQFAPIRRVTNERVEWLDTNRGWQRDTLADFVGTWNQVVLLIEPTAQAGEANYLQKRREERVANARLPVIIVGMLLSLAGAGTLFLPAAVLGNASLCGLLLTKLAGVGVTTLLLWHSIDANNGLLRSLCRLDSRTDCNSVLTAKAATLWGWLSWSEIGFTYFAGSWLALLLSLNLGSPSVLSWLLLLNGLVLPYTFYSVYYQYRVAKSWCTLCLLVQALLWAEFTLGIHYWQAATFAINGQTVILLGLAFLWPVVLWMLLKRPLQQATQVYPLRRELQRAKFNPDYVESLFANQPKMPPIFEGMRVAQLGNSQADHTLTVVTNPLCGPCRRLHPNLEALMQRTDTVDCQFVFIGSSRAVPITRRLLSLPPTAAEQAMHLWYGQSGQDIGVWSQAIMANAHYADADQQLQLHARWCEMAQVTATPTLYLDGRQLPLTYTLNDVETLCRILGAVPRLMESVDSHKSVV